MSSLALHQLACFLFVGAYVVEKLALAITGAVEGYEDDSGFHWTQPNGAPGAGLLGVAPV